LREKIEKGGDLEGIVGLRNLYDRTEEQEKPLLQEGNQHIPYTPLTTAKSERFLERGHRPPLGVLLRDHQARGRRGRPKGKRER